MAGRFNWSGRKPEMHHVAVGNNVILAFEPHFSGVTRAGLPIALDEVVIADGFGSDKPAFEIGMDHSGCLRRLGALCDRPGPRFLRSDGKISHEMQKRIAGADETIEAGFLEPDRFEKFCALARWQSGNFRFDLRGNHDRYR